MAKKQETEEIPIFSMADLVKEIKKIGDGRYNFMTPASQMKMGDVIPFYYHVLNLITYGGFPYGGIHEFFGHSQTGKCLVGSTLLTGPTGELVKMEELMMPRDSAVPLPPHTLLEDDTWYRLKEAISVLNNQYREEVFSRFYYGGKREVISLLLGNYMQVVGTPDHHLTVFYGGQEQDMSIENIVALVRKGEKVETLVPVPSSPLYEQLGAAHETLVGPYKKRLRGGGGFSAAYVAGVLCRRVQYNPSYSEQLRVVGLPKVDDVFAENSNTRGAVRNFVNNVLSEWNQAQTVSLEDPKLLDWCVENEILGTSVYTAEIPRCIRMGTCRDRFDFLCGVLRTGELVQNRIKITTRSQAFFQQLYMLSLGLGIVPFATTGISCGSRTAWSLEFSPLHNELLLVKALEPRRFDDEKLVDLTKRCELLRKDYAVLDSAFPFPLLDGVLAGGQKIMRVPILRGTLLNNHYPVYDVEMPETHHYIANGVKSHNSYYMYRMAAMSQRMFPDTVVMMLDKENAYNPDRGAQLGLNNDTVLHYPSHTIGMPADVVLAVSDMQNFLLKKYKTGVPHLLVILDSIAAFKSGANYGKENMGKSAKHWHEAFRELMDLMYTNVMMLVANHVTYNPNVMFGSNETKAQSNATNYYRTCGIGLEHGRKILNEHGDVIGENMLAIVDKTRSGPSFRKAYIPFLFDQSKCTPLDGYLRFLSSRGILEPSNKEDYKKFKTKTLLYHAPGLDKPIQLMDDQPAEVIAKYPQLYFNTYPEFGGGDWVAGQEDGMLEDMQAAFENNKEPLTEVEINANIGQLMQSVPHNGIPKL